MNIFDEELSTFVLRLSSNYCYRCPLIDYYYLLAVLLSPALQTPQNKVQPSRSPYRVCLGPMRVGLSYSYIEWCRILSLFELALSAILNQLFP